MFPSVLPLRREQETDLMLAKWLGIFAVLSLLLVSGIAFADMEESEYPHPPIRRMGSFLSRREIQTLLNI